MAKKEEPAANTAAEGKPVGKSKLKLIVLIVVGFLLAIGLSIGGTLFFLGKTSKADAEHASEETTEHAEVAAVKPLAIYEALLPAFVVNYNKNGKQRYMQVTLAMMARSKDELDALKVHMPVLRNQLVMLLSSQDFAVLTTPAGKELLRQQATAKIQEFAEKETGKPVVEQVLFTNFVLQ